MYEIGRVCVKIAGRDAGKKCLIIDTINKSHVLIDGQTRRRKCNVKHLEPLGQVLKVTKNAPRPEVIRLFKGLKIEIKETKPKKKTEKPKRLRKKKEKPVKKAPVKKAPEKKVKEVKAVKPETKPAPPKPKAEEKK
ncbi:hypothetical protein KY341_02935 [Candidatus Woesearchaeota archaeon]|nr:hypothetical protein [Candidatus Woesearchaeota archaeon]